MVLEITDLDENQKDKLRGAIKYFSGDRNNIKVKIKVDDELKSCGAIYLTEEILKVFQDIVGKKNVEIKKIA